jgi:peptidoglycan/xylan/chitin deacetylase (PgdA/CDA1 family)
MNRIYPLFIDCLAGLLMATFLFHPATVRTQHTVYRGAIIRGDSTVKTLALIFSGDEYGEGLNFIQNTLKQYNIPASFFFTGKFYRNHRFLPGIKLLARDGHFMGAHSDQHLLYCDWSQRDSLLVTQQQFELDLLRNYESMEQAGVDAARAKYFLPPYEWYNDTISSWAKNLGIQLINFTPGTLSHTDYTTLSDKNYRDNQTIFQSIIEFENHRPGGLNGFILLMHIGAGEKRKEKFYNRLPELISFLKEKGYQFKPVDQLLN